MSRSALHAVAKRATRETPPKTTKLMDGPWQCERCGLPGNGGLGHESADECIKTLKARLVFKESAYKAQQQTIKRLEAKVTRIEARSIKGGLVNRIVALESAGVERQEQIDMLSARVKFLTGEGRSHASSEANDLL